ncbi:hypothetical protein ASG17_04450 [Brevundimonas sp. Leaf363]|uniref:hypothetical protein n=1 Tax=Brevundimonas sp. Leaf363 TaxID=1736353 RepID=UPI0006F998CD|nr:hypothetical protein [Brevundimonas sp. Leaf363]KQS55344.1 hypothetical protein ASG17_04450 [Brevundimonas sp. Leaf363]
MRRLALLATIFITGGCAHGKTQQEVIAIIPLGASETEVFGRLGPTSNVVQMPGGYVIRLWFLNEPYDVLSVVFDRCGRVMAVSDKDGAQRFQTPCTLP